MKNYDTIIWDWNGTLIDDINTSLQSVNDMLIKRNMATITLQQYYSYLDTPISKFYEHIFDMGTITFETISKEFTEGYAKHIPQNPLMEHAKEMLNYIKALNKKQLIISSFAQKKICKDAKALGINGYFNCLSGAEDYNAKSKIQRAKEVVAQNAPWDNLLVVGDTLHDFQMAQGIGADCVLITKGHQSKRDLLKAGVPLIDDLISLKEIIY